MITYKYIMSNDKDILYYLSNLLAELNSTHGVNNKKEILKTIPKNIQHIIQLIWDPNTKTGIKKITLLKYKNNSNYKELGLKDLTLYQIFNKLINKDITGHKAKATVCNYIDKYSEYEELIIMIFEKNLRTRLGYKTISGIFPNMFNYFTCLLAADFKEELFKKQLKKHEDLNIKGYISDKKDGVRVFFHKFSNNTWEALSRDNNKFTTLNKFFEQFNEMKLPKEELWIEGEFISLQEGKENFKSTVSRLKRKNKIGLDDITDDAVFWVFDLLTNDQFRKNKNDNNMIYQDRLKKINKYIFDTDLIKVLPQIEYKNLKQLETIKQDAKKRKIEGLMFRFNHEYENKRSNNLLKIKFFEVLEAKVVDENIELMIFPNKNGGEERLKALRNVYIMYKGNKVSVGSGFNKKERLHYANNSIIGKVISIQYQEELYDKKTKSYSLRMPTFHGIWGEKRNM